MSINITYSFSNNTTIDPAEVNQNNTDLLDNIKKNHHADPDGTKINQLDMDIGFALLKSRMIVEWSGLISEIPGAFFFCNGSNGTPDLRDKMIVGAKEDSGGVSKTNISGSLTVSGGQTSINQSHKHTVSGNVNFTIGHTHPYSNTTGSSGSHNHTFAGSTDDSENEDGGDGSGLVAKNSHNHNFAGTTSTKSSHTHSNSGTSDLAGGHVHSMDIDSDIKLSTQTILNPYYALAKIMVK